MSTSVKAEEIRRAMALAVWILFVALCSHQVSGQTYDNAQSKKTDVPSCYFL